MMPPTSSDISSDASCGHAPSSTSVRDHVISLSMACSSQFCSQEWRTYSTAMNQQWLTNACPHDLHGIGSDLLLNKLFQVFCLQLQLSVMLRFGLQQIFESVALEVQHLARDTLTREHHEIHIHISCPFVVWLFLADGPCNKAVCVSKILRVTESLSAVSRVWRTADR